MPLELDTQDDSPLAAAVSRYAGDSGRTDPVPLPIGGLIHAVGYGFGGSLTEFITNAPPSRADPPPVAERRFPASTPLPRALPPTTVFHGNRDGKARGGFSRCRDRTVIERFSRSFRSDSSGRPAGPPRVSHRVV